MRSSESLETKKIPAFNTPAALRLIKDFARYLVKAVFVVAVLMVLGKLAPLLPSFAFPFVFLLYAIPATLGALYNVVNWRLRRQSWYTEDGRLSRFNRRWMGWLVVLFVLSLFSALVFYISAPSWDDLMWGLIWLSVPAFYVVFLALRRIVRREYASKFYRAQAITWSLVCVALLLCLAYAVIGAGSSLGAGIDFKDAIQGRIMVFKDSSCALLCEADKLNSYANYLTKYGLSYVEGFSFAAAFVAKIFVSIPIFFGFIGQLAFCLLSREEIKSEFRLLPVDGEESEEHPIRKSYLAAALGVWLALSVVFLGVEYEISKAKTTNEDTVVNGCLEELTDDIALAIDPDPISEWVELTEEYQQNRKAYIDENRGAVESSIVGYYDNCINNFDSYIEWRDGLWVGYAAVKFFAPDNAVNEFESRVVDPAAGNDPSGRFQEYVGGLNDIRRRHFENMIGLDSGSTSSDKDFVETTANLELWPRWDSEEGSKTKMDVLWADGDRGAVKSKIVEFIERRRTIALDKLDETTRRFEQMDTII